MGRAAIEQLLYLMDEAFEGADEEDLLRTITDSIEFCEENIHELQAQIDDGVLSDREVDPLADEGLKPRRGDPDLVFTRH